MKQLYLIVGCRWLKKRKSISSKKINIIIILYIVNNIDEVILWIL